MERFGRRSAPPFADPVDTGAFSRLEAEVLRLSRERTHVAIENLLLNELIGRNARSGAERLLQRIVPDPHRSQAIFVDLTSSTPQVLALRGAALKAPMDVEVPQEVRELLTHEPLLKRLIQVRSTPDETHALTVLQWEPHGRTSDEKGAYYLVSIREGQRLLGLLATTSLWPPGMPQCEQVESLSRLGQAILRRRLEERRHEQHQHELWIATEKLRPKALTDRATEEPLKTLGEFVAGLCEAVQMERAVVYLVTRRAGDVPQPVVEAGSGLTATQLESWRTEESKLAANAMSQIHGEILDHERMGALAVWPLQSGGRKLGTLILSGHHDGPLREDLGELVDWGSNLLAQTLHRIYRDASIRRQARHDGLTDLANRRTFDALISVEAERVRLGVSEECSLLLADLDRFKGINDRFGHQAGDEVLREVAQLLRDHVSRMRVGERSLLARYGGEELAILLPGVGTAGALRIAEEIRGAVERLTIEFGNRKLQVTVSIGVASCPLNGLGAADLVAAADAALYRAKSEGRNRVCRQTDHPR